MWLILVLALGTFALGTDALVMAGVLPAIAHDLSVPVATTGQLVTVFALTYVLASPTLATLTGSMARRHLLLGSLGVFVAANLLAAFATNFEILVFARVLAACGAALYTPTASAVAAMLAPAEKRGRALALVTAGITVAVVLGVPVGTLVGTFLGWQMTFGLVAVLGMLAALGILLFFPAVASPPPLRLHARLAPLQNPQVIIALSLTTLWILGGFMVYIYLALLLQHITHLGGTGISSLLLVLGLASVVGNALGGHGADRWGATRTIAISLAVLAVTLAVFPLAAISVFGATVALLVWGVAAWMLSAPQQHRLLALVPESPSAILSLNGSATYFGQAGGAVIGGLVLHAASLSAMGWVGGVCEIIALGMLLLSTQSERTMKSLQENCMSGGERPCVATVSQSDDAVLS